jgi:tetratricopeptide (TPR) repeat protein
MWQFAIRSNLVADAANRDYAASTSPAAAANPSSILARYHNLDFLTNAYLQLAKDRSAKAILDERNSIAELPASERITVHTAYAAIPVRYAFERGAWKEAATLARMKTPYKQAEAIVWFGRAIGAARSSDVAAANEDLIQISRLRQELAAAGDPYWAEQVGFQEAAASGWIALAEKNVPQAIALMRDAADREDRTEKHVAMENRLSPMRELLGELLLEAGRPRDALREFELSLRTMPNRFRSLAGAGQSAALTGNRRLARSYYDRLLSQAGEADGARPALSAARAFVAQAGR